MDPQAQASFIPKKPLMSTTHAGSGMGLFYLVAIFVFVLSLVAAGAAFAYTRYLDSTLASKAHSLELAQGAYEPGAIQDLNRLDQRIAHAKTLLGRHIAPSVIFTILSDETLEQVQFTDFSYKFAEGGKVVMLLTGSANSFSTVALQSDEFGASKALSDVVFSDITVDTLGKVNFSVSASIQPDRLLYKNNISQASAPTSPEEGESTETP